VDDETRNAILVAAADTGRYLIALGNPAAAETLAILVARAMAHAANLDTVAYVAAADQVLAFCRDHHPDRPPYP
jgi:hypothetical protein